MKNISRKIARALRKWADLIDPDNDSTVEEISVRIDATQAHVEIELLHSKLLALNQAARESIASASVALRTVRVKSQ